VAALADAAEFAVLESTHAADDPSPANSHSEFVQRRAPLLFADACLMASNLRGQICTGGLVPVISNNQTITIETLGVDGSRPVHPDVCKKKQTSNFASG
jgi:hypothetical protein